MTLIRQELRDTDGRTIGYVVPVEEMNQLLAENARLKAEATRRTEASYLAIKEQVLAEWVPVPATPAEMEEVKRLGDNSHIITEIVARMYRQAEGGDGSR